MNSLEKEMKKVEKRLNELEQKRHSPSPQDPPPGVFPDNRMNGYTMDLELQQIYSDFSILKIRYLMENL